MLVGIKRDDRHPVGTDQVDSLGRHAARRKQLEAGEETEINVLDAENEVFNAQINETGAEYDARTAVYRMLLALGRLTPEVGR